jgi:hypothetical protein
MGLEEAGPRLTDPAFAGSFAPCSKPISSPRSLCCYSWESCVFARNFVVLVLVLELVLENALGLRVELPIDERNR